MPPSQLALGTTPRASGLSLHTGKPVLFSWGSLWGLKGRLQQRGWSFSPCSPSSSSTWPQSFRRSCSQGLADEFNLGPQRPSRIPGGKQSRPKWPRGPSRTKRKVKKQSVPKLRGNHQLSRGQGAVTRSQRSASRVVRTPREAGPRNPGAVAGSQGSAEGEGWAIPATESRRSHRTAQGAGAEGRPRP